MSTYVYSCKKYIKMISKLEKYLNICVYHFLIHFEFLEILPLRHTAYRVCRSFGIFYDEVFRIGIFYFPGFGFNKNGLELFSRIHTEKSY